MSNDDLSELPINKEEIEKKFRKLERLKIRLLEIEKNLWGQRE